MIGSDDEVVFDSSPVIGQGSRKRAELTAAQFAALPARHIPCGYFTLGLTDGSEKRFRIRLERGSFLTGVRTLARYCKVESDDSHEREWETIGTLGAEGFSLFKRWRNEWESRWAAAIWKLLNGQDAGGYALAVEERCWMTMRVLTDDDAKRTGLCATWRKRFAIKGGVK